VSSCHGVDFPEYSFPIIGGAFLLNNCCFQSVIIMGNDILSSTPKKDLYIPARKLPLSKSWRTLDPGEI
jgi:hypothetical protein